MIGGMSWESSAEYYRVINRGVKERLGGHHSASLVMYSVDFSEVEELQHRGGWDELTEMMVDAASRVQRAGADFLLICTNTMHKLAGEVEERIPVPLLHIADATAEAVLGEGFEKVGLLGTRFTMEEDFYRGRLRERHGIEVLIPAEEDRREVHRVVYDEFCNGRIEPDSRRRFRDVIGGLVEEGAQGIVLGCTEIPLFIGEEDSPVDLFDTTTIHAMAAVDYALR